MNILGLISQLIGIKTLRLTDILAWLMGFTNLILEIDFLIVYKFLVNNIIVVNYYDGSYMTHMIQTIVVKYYNGGSHHVK